MERLKSKEAAIAARDYKEFLRNLIETHGLRDDEVARLTTLEASDPTCVLDLETRAEEIRARRDGGEDFRFKMPGEEGYDPEAMRSAEYDRIDAENEMGAQLAASRFGAPVVETTLSVSKA